MPLENTISACGKRLVKSVLGICDNLDMTKKATNQNISRYLFNKTNPNQTVLDLDSSADQISP